MWRLAWLLALLPGCGSLAIQLHVPRPAAIPARTFPVVCVAGEGSDEARDIALAIADHLAGSDTRVVTTTPARLLGMAATEPEPALALLVSVSLTEALTTEMSSMPSVRCESVSPCYGYPTRLPIDVRVQIGEVLVRALDPRRAAELGRATRHAEESEPSPIAARLAVLDRLRALAIALVDVADDVIDLELDAPPDDATRSAIDAARAGNVHDARLALDAHLADPSLSTDVRIAIAFDRAQLLRADVDSATPSASDEHTRLADAEAALLAVVQQAPDERHERALMQIRTERAAREDVRTQQAAADANFARSSAPP